MADLMTLCNGIPCEVAHSMLSQIAALEAKLAEERKDAERYRFILNNVYVAGDGWRFNSAIPLVDQYDYLLAGRAKLSAFNAAIDAALKESSNG